MLYAVCAVSTIARGRVARLDVEAAKAASARRGRDDPRQPAAAGRRSGSQAGPVRVPPGGAAERPCPLRGPTDRARRRGDTGGGDRGGRAPASPLRGRTAAPRADMERFIPEAVGVGSPPSATHGDVEAGLSAAPLSIDATYETPPQYHNAMEPHAIVASWDGDRLTLDTPNQAPIWPARLCRLLRRPAGERADSHAVHRRRLRLESDPGGGAILCALAARMTGRPVKLMLTRAQMFGPVGHRGQTRQRLRLGMERDGRLTALSHHAIAATSSFDEFIERPPAFRACSTPARPSPSLTRPPATTSARRACARRASPPGRRRSRSPSTKRRKLAAWTRSTSGSSIMRRSSRSPASPIRRRRCANATPGARRRSAGRPAARAATDARRGRFLVGRGMGTAAFHCPMFAAEARAALHGDGTATVETSAIDMARAP